MEFYTDSLDDQVVDVPPHFLCPISLQLMRDPVTVTTGITYDRESIEKWLFFFNNATCPVTKQPLSPSSDLTPNYTLKRLIHSWCTFNSIDLIIPTPNHQSSSSVDVSFVRELIQEARSDPSLVACCIGRFRTMCCSVDKGKNNLEKAGAVDFLVSVIVAGVKMGGDLVNKSTLEDAIFLIRGMDAATFKNMAANNVEFIHSLVDVMRCGTQYSRQSRFYSTLILRSLFQETDPNHVINVSREVFKGITQILRDNISARASKTAMKLLMEICPWGRNRIKAVEANVVKILIDFLLGNSEKRIVEISLIVLDQLTGCAEGRSELINHEMGLAVVGKNLLRVSHSASDRAVRVLSSVSKHSANPMVLQEMLNVGIVEKMLLVLLVDCGVKMKEKCREMLKLHARVWRTSPCIPPHLLSYYPSF